LFLNYLPFLLQPFSANLNRITPGFTILYIQPE